MFLMRNGAKGLTLLELIVVMAMMAIIVAVVTPAMSPFFAGRNLNNEARRLLALTRYARNEAAATGQMMEIWIDPVERVYGLETANPYAREDLHTRQYYMADGLEIEIGLDPAETGAESLEDEYGLTRVAFRPDGTGSGEILYLYDSKGYGLQLEPMGIGQGYALRELE